MSKNNEEMANDSATRRRWLKGVSAAGIAGLAGCGADDSGDSGERDAGGGGDGDLQPIEGEILDNGRLRMVLGFTQSEKPGYYEYGRRVQENMQEIGLDVEFHDLAKPNPSTEVRYDTREWDFLVMAMSSQAYRIDPTFYLRTVMHSNQADTQGTFNMSNYRNDYFDMLSDEQIETYDTDERRDVVMEAQEVEFVDQAWSTYVWDDIAEAWNTDHLVAPTEDQLVPSSRSTGSPYVWSELEAGPANDENMLKFSILNPWEAFNPVNQTRSRDYMINNVFYDKLTVFGPDAAPYPWAAEDFRGVDDTTVEVDIREGIEWEDGSGDLNAEDVAFSYKFHKEHQNPNLVPFLESFEGAEAVDEYRVQFNLNESDASFITTTMSLTHILPKHIWENVDNPAEVATNPGEGDIYYGSGPWEVTRWRADQLLEFEANHDHPHAPNFDGMLQTVYGSNDAANQAVIQGDAHITTELLAQHWDLFEDEESTELLLRPSISQLATCYNTRDYHGGGGEGPPRQSFPWDDRVFRNALAWIIPREQLLEEVYGGAGSTGGSIIGPANEFWHHQGIEPKSYDLDRAREILRAGGYDWDEDGNLLMPNPEDVPDERRMPYSEDSREVAIDEIQTEFDDPY